MESNDQKVSGINSRCCIQCGEVIRDDKVIEMNNQFDFLSNGGVIHKRKCFEEFDKEHLSGEEAIKRGAILSLCNGCGLPVRSKDCFKVFRLCYPSKNLSEDKIKQIELTTLPGCEDVLRFFHEHCF